MKITKAKLKQIIKEELGAVGAHDQYEWLEEFESLEKLWLKVLNLAQTLKLNETDPEGYEVVQQLHTKYNNAISQIQRSLGGGEQAEPKEEEEDDLKDWEPESEYIERWAREQGIPEDEF